MFDNNPGIEKMTTRREFIKQAAAIVAAAALGSAVSAGDSGEKKMEKKKMKMLVLTGSPRAKGNSATLADEFIKGAKEAGHTVARFDAAFKKVNPCSACDHCGMNGPCVYKDDFEFVRENIVNADCVVFATPMYYFGISAQLKLVIDRFYAINGQIHVPKKAVLLMTYANTSSKDAKPIISHYETLLDYLGWKDAGQIIAPGVWPVGAIKETKYPAMAYKLGKSIS
jgi:multimeric flavodoxin WrbA